MEKLRKPLLIVCGGFAILFIFIFIMSSCSKKTYTSQEFAEYLVDSAKEYYSFNQSSLPQVDSGKTSLSINTLIEEPEEYLGDVNSCSGSIEVINNGGYYMYIPNISCIDGYKSTKLSQHLTSPENIVSTGNGLYGTYDYYIYRGDNVNNYVLFNEQLWRIIRINADGTIRMIETNQVLKKEKKESLEFKNSKRTSVIWDDRYNSEKNYTSGFNDYIHNGLNSRIKDTLDEIYENDFSDETKGYIVKQNLCIGKRSVADTINDGSIECSNILPDQNLGLLQVNEYINASLDATCVSAESVTCSNYNYLATLKSTFWSITAVRDNSYEVFKIGSNIKDSTASSSSTPKIVINISSESRFTDGNGTEENPYVIK